MRAAAREDTLERLLEATGGDIRGRHRADHRLGVAPLGGATSTTTSCRSTWDIATGSLRAWRWSPQPGWLEGSRPSTPGSARSPMISDPNLVIGVRLIDTGDVGLGHGMAGEPTKFVVDTRAALARDGGPLGAARDRKHGGHRGRAAATRPTFRWGASGPSSRPRRAWCSW